MQYVQRLSQPSCTFIWTRVRDINLALMDAGKVASCSIKGGDGLSGFGSSSVGSMVIELSLPICCIYCVARGNIGNKVPAREPSLSPGCGSSTIDDRADSGASGCLS